MPSLHSLHWEEYVLLYRQGKYGDDNASSESTQTDKLADGASFTGKCTPCIVEQSTPCGLVRVILLCDLFL
jgi:hypothetical protein